MAVVSKQRSVIFSWLGLITGSVRFSKSSSDFIRLSLNTLFICLYLLLTKAYCQTPKADSIKNLLQTENDKFISSESIDTIRVSLLNALGWELVNRRPDTSIILLTQSLSLATQIGWKNGIANALGNLGVCYKNQGNYPKALEHYFKALKIDKELGNKNGSASRFGNVGIVYKNIGDYPKALRYHFKALELAIELGKQNYKAACLGNIGIVFGRQGDYAKALVYYLKALELAQKLENKSYIASILGNMGSVYLNQGNPKQALEHYIKAFEMHHESGNHIGKATQLANIGLAYYHLDDFTKALEYYFKALKIAEALGDKRGISFHLDNIGALYIDEKRYTEAEAILQRALSVSQEIGFVLVVRGAHKNLSRLYQEIGETKIPALYNKACNHHEKYLEAMDSLFNEEKSKTMGKLEARHEFALIEIEMDRVKTQEERLEKERIKKRDEFQFNLIYIIVLVFLFISIIIIFSKFNIPGNGKPALLFITLLLLFEFVLVLADSKIEQITVGDPFYKLGVNGLMAMVFYFIQVYFGKILALRKDKKIVQASNNKGFGKFLMMLCIIISFTHLSAFSPKYSINVVDGESKNDSTEIQTNYAALDSLKTLLIEYQNKFNEYRSNNKYKDAYIVIKEFSILKDSLQQLEQVQELNKLSEKLKLEEYKVQERIIAEEQLRIQTASDKRNKLLKYSIILIIIALLFITLSLFATKNRSKLLLPKRYLEGGLFVAFLLFFEFIIVLTDPYVEAYTGNAPAWKLIFNMLLAIVSYPAHHFLEGKIRGRLFAAKRFMVNS